MLLPLNRLL